MSDVRRWRSLGWTLATLAGLGCAAGCMSEAPVPIPQVSATAPADRSADAPAPAAQAERPELTPVDRSGYDRALVRLRGKVVLVDFWASWCGPCVEQLSHTADLAERHPADEFAAVTMALEDPESAERLAGLLAQRGAAGLTHWINADGGGSRAMEAFEIAGGALPHYKLYDRTGALRCTFGLDPAAARQFTPQDVEQAVAELLAE